MTRWSAEQVHACFQEAGVWKDSWAFSKRILEFISAAGRMADAELSWKKDEFNSSVGKTVAMYYDICAYLDFSPDIANARRASETYSVDLVNSAISWAYTAFAMKERRSPSFGKLGYEWIGHVFNSMWAKMPNDASDQELVDAVNALLHKQMSAQCIAFGLPVTKFLGEQKQITMIAAPNEKIEVPF